MRPSLAGMSGKYLIRTYGCQMNEHDSERLAGLLEADGLSPADGLELARVLSPAAEAGPAPMARNAMSASRNVGRRRMR